MEGIGTRIAIARGEMSRRQLARDTGVSHQTIGLWESGENEPKRENLDRLAMALGVSVDWLLTGRSSAKHDGLRRGPVIPSSVPILTWGSLDDWRDTIPSEQSTRARLLLPCPVAHGPNTFAVVVEGDSMSSPQSPSYPAGCTIFVDPDAAETVKSGDRVIARLETPDGLVVAFKVFIEDSGRRMLKPLNPLYPMIEGPFRILGKVLGQFSE